jgi:hypothetical protein
MLALDTVFKLKVGVQCEQCIIERIKFSCWLWTRNFLKIFPESVVQAKFSHPRFIESAGFPGFDATLSVEKQTMVMLIRQDKHMSKPSVECITKPTAPRIVELLEAAVSVIREQTCSNNKMVTTFCVSGSYV